MWSTRNNLKRGVIFMHTFSIPDVVRVGITDYQIIKSPVVVTNGMELVMGACDSNNETIMLSNQISPNQQNFVFCHELVHGILFEMGQEEHDEKFVDAFSRILYQILRDNYFYIDGEPPRIGFKNNSTDENIQKSAVKPAVDDAVKEDETVA